MTNLTVMAISAGDAVASGLLTDGMKTAFEAALNGVKTDVFSLMSSALPIGIGIAGVFIAIRLGMRFFHSVAN